MKYHQGIRAEIETRNDNFRGCKKLGESLLERQHQDSEEASRRGNSLAPTSGGVRWGSYGPGVSQEELGLMPAPDSSPSLPVRSRWLGGRGSASPRTGTVPALGLKTILQGWPPRP